MGVLQAFERRLSSLVEGTFARVFKSDVQPAEIAGALQREADAKKNVVTRDRVLAPNDYVIELGQHDYNRLAEWAEPLGDELAAMVREHAAEVGYSFVGPVKVGFELQAGIGTGVFRIRSGAVAGDEPSPAVAPARTPAAAAPIEQPIDPPIDRPTVAAGTPRPAPPGAYPSRPRLIVSAHGDESAYFLTHPVTVIGRAADSDVRLDDSGVSRRHAEIRYSEGKVGIVDLGSTNGVLVNGRSVERAELADGDRIDVANSTLIFRRDED